MPVIYAAIIREAAVVHCSSDLAACNTRPARHEASEWYAGRVSRAVACCLNQCRPVWRAFWRVNSAICSNTLLLLRNWRRERGITFIWLIVSRVIYLARCTAHSSVCSSRIAPPAAGNPPAPDRGDGWSYSTPTWYSSGAAEAYPRCGG